MGPRKLTRRQHGWLAIASLLLVLVASLVALRLSFQSPPVLFVSVKSNHLEYRVKRPVLARLAIVGGLWIRPEVKCRGVALSRGDRHTFLLSPPPGSKVEYLSLPQHIQVSVTPEQGDKVRLLNTRKRMGCDLDGTVSVLIPVSEVARNQPFPVFGPVTIGSDAARNEPPPHEYLRKLTPKLEVETIPVRFIESGRVKMFGRIEWLRQLYPVGDAEFPIPRGSRIEFDAEDVSGSVIRAPDGAVFDIQFTVESSAMRVFRPGKSQQYETFATGLVVRAFSDPVLSVIFLVVGLSGFLLTILSYLHSVWTNRGEDT